MLWKLTSTHGPPEKHATPVPQPVWLGVGIEDPSGVVEIQAHSRGTVEKISTYISSHKHMHVHTRPLRHVVWSLSWHAGINGFLGIPILGITLPAHLEEKSLAVSTVTQYSLDILGVLLKLGGHSSNLLRVI